MNYSSGEKEGSNANYAAKKERQNRNPDNHRAWKVLQNAVHGLYKDGWTQNSIVTLVAALCCPFLIYMFMTTPKGMLYSFGVGATIALWGFIFAIGKHIGDPAPPPATTAQTRATSGTALPPNQPPTSAQQPLQLSQPKFSETVDVRCVWLGEKGKGYFAAFPTQVKGTAAGVVLNLNGTNVVKTDLVNGILCVDAEIISNASGNTFRLKNNNVENRPLNWDKNSSESALEIVDENGVPRFQLIYLDERSASVKGIFLVPGIAVLADDNGVRQSSISDLKLQKYDCKPIFAYPAWKYPGEFRK